MLGQSLEGGREELCEFVATRHSSSVIRSSCFKIISTRGTLDSDSDIGRSSRGQAELFSGLLPLIGIAVVRRWEEFYPVRFSLTKRRLDGGADRASGGQVPVPSPSRG